MEQTELQRQTLFNVAAYVGGVMAVFGVGNALPYPTFSGGPGLIEGVLTGASISLVMIAVRYYRLPLQYRLAPSHAIGLGLFNVSVLAWELGTRVDPVTRAFMTWAPALLLSLPALYLIVAGVIQLHQAGNEDTSG